MAAIVTLSSSLSSLTFSPFLRSPPSQLSFRPSSTSPLSIIKFQNPFSPMNSKQSTSSLLPVYSNAFLCKANSGAYNVEVGLEEGEDIDSFVQRFRREVSRAGIIPEIKRRRYHENSQEKRKRKTMEAAKRYGSGNKRRLRARREMEEKLKMEKEEEDMKEAAEVEDYEKENWDEDVADFVPYPNLQI